MGKTLNISLAQLNPHVGDLDYNAQKLMESWAISEKEKSDILIFPELFLCGYPPEDLVFKADFINNIEQHITKIIEASKNKDTALVLPTPLKKDGHLYNAALVIQKGQIIGESLKIQLPNYGVFDEKRTFTASSIQKQNPIELEGHDIKLGIMICEDMWSDDLALHYKDKGAELLIAINGSPYSQNKAKQRQQKAFSCSSCTKLPLIYLNQIGGQDELVFDGRSFGVYENQNTANLGFMMPAFEEKLQTITVHSVEEKENPFKTSEALEIEEKKTEIEPYSDIYQALCLGLKDYVRKNGFSGVTLGLSGGIDSALCACIATSALGPENVYAYMLPSQFTSPESIEDAHKLAKNLSVFIEDIDIQKQIEISKETLLNLKLPTPDNLDNKDIPEIVFENIQPRHRALLLMAISNATGLLLLSTGNKSELAMGYATLYGDMCGGFNPIKDLYKTQVYELAQHLNNQALKEGRELIPSRIISKPPSAELKENQCDQDTLPEYKDLDSMLYAFIEEDLSPEDLNKNDYDPKLAKDIFKRLHNNEHKRWQACPGTKISNRCFGKDRRYPITNRFKS